MYLAYETCCYFNFDFIIFFYPTLWPMYLFISLCIIHWLFMYYIMSHVLTLFFQTWQDGPSVPDAGGGIP
jgi:hypothetical protein